ncbi:uncharacterized protein SPSK_00715 [Sporothrix schenckii 1099-18]|uniref:Major facilitator superfamily (MFS) profile domain-containing protein n=1 Tax=Sporothrix schenckii 1099-18 TaxID=1397361 RepID=A0A0F2LVU2_SPOSC|nr:uncharacterized protein SPSK_00715 [Sporothrix schenckii 1099-18]KJR81573.1 hypothetical protein SPSK_00715 [Sporothrix schenckii 1099-18]
MGSDGRTVGTAEELLLRGERYRDTFGRNEIESLPVLSNDDDNDDEEGTSQAPSRQTWLQRWGLRRPAWMASRQQPPRHYQPIHIGDDSDDVDDNASTPSDTTTDVEADAGVDYSYSDEPAARAQNKQRQQERRDSDDDVDEDDADADAASNPRRRVAGAAWYQAQRPGSVIALVAVLLFFLVFAATLALVPMLRLVEDAICRRHYGLNYGDDGGSNSTVSVNTHKQFLENDFTRTATNGTDERLCKVDAVQAELAWLGGVVSVTEAIFGLLASFPWALLSDRIGRKPVFRISFIGASLSFGWTSLILLRRDVLSVWWVLTCELFLLVGGGAGVAVTILHSIVTDVVVGDRASGFIWLAVGAVTGSIIGPGCAAVLMMTGGPDGEGHSAWLPICLTLFVLTPIILLLTVFLPETLPKKVAASSSSSSSRSTVTTTSSMSTASFWMGTIPAHLRETFQQLLKTLAVLRRSRPSLLLLPSYLFQPAIQSVQGGILAQSVSKRFGWSLAQTGYLFSFRGVVTVVVLILIPIITKYILVGSVTAAALHTNNNKKKARGGCTGLGMSEVRKDLFLARTSLMCLIVGNLLMATGTSLSTLVLGLVLSTFAVGFGSVLRSLITHFFLEQQKSTPTNIAAAGPVATTTAGGQDGQDDKDSKDDHTSRLYTLTGMVETAGSVLAGPMVAWTFSSGLALGGAWIGLPFFYVTGLCVAALVCLVVIGDGSRDSATSSGSGGRIRLSTTSDRRDNDHEEVGSGQIALP